jgi:O-antigen ligase
MATSIYTDNVITYGVSSENSQHSFLDKLSFTSLIAIMLLVSIPYGGAEPWWESLFQSAIMLLTALWAIRYTFNKAKLPSELPVFVPLILVVVLAVIQTLPLNSSYPWVSISYDPFATLLSTLKILSLISLMMLVSVHVSTKRRMQILIYSLVLIGVISAVFGLTRKLTLLNQTRIMTQYFPDVSGFAQFINYNHFGFLAEMTLGLLLGLMHFSKKRIVQIVTIALIALVWSSILLSNSRAAVLVSIVQFLLCITLYLRRLSFNNRQSEMIFNNSWLTYIITSLFMRIVLVAAMVVISLIGIFTLGGETLLSRFETMGNEISSSEATDRATLYRREIWSATAGVIKENILFGAGFGALQGALPRHHDDPGYLIVDTAHNDYLELLAVGGIMGGLLFIWFVIGFWKRITIQLNDSDSFQYARSMGALIGISGVAIHSIVDFGLHIMINAAVLACLIVIATKKKFDDELESL